MVDFTMEPIALKLLRQIAANNPGEDCEDEYSTMKTDEDRVKFTLGYLRENRVAAWLPEPSTKSFTASEAYREKGNKFFVTPGTAPQLDTTIELYTQSIVFAPSGSRALALGYANRSAALFKARLYQDCLQDISRALALPYPDELKAKLYARRARCLMTLKSPTEDQKEELKEALKMAAEYLGKMVTDNQGRRLVEKMLKEPEKMVPAEGEYMKWRGESLIPKVSDESPEIRGVSSALKLEFNKKFGRHVVATRDISPGEVLALAKPYAGILLYKQRFTHCAYCMMQTWSSVPCEGCCEVVFCSEDCKNKANKEYHDTDCQFMRHVTDTEMSDTSRLSVRLAVKAINEAGSIQALREKVKEIEGREDPRIIGFTQGLLDDRDYASVYTLMRNTENRQFIDLLGMSLVSSYTLLAMATKSDLFGKKFEGKFDELEGDADVTFVGGLMMRHTQILYSNAHCLYEEELHPENSIEKGSALMPFFSLMNHTCNSGISRVSYGMNIAFYTEYAVKKGEQVFDNYGLNYSIIPRLDRQKKLQEQYYFKCDCIACTENWPTLSMGIPSFTLLPQRTQQRLANVLKNYPKYRRIAVNGDLTDSAAIIADMNNMVKVFQQTVRLPCRELIEVNETRKRILALTGNRFQSVNVKN